MSAPEGYQRIHRLIAEQADPRVDASTLTRLAWYVTGLIGARHGSPAQVAKALFRLGLTGATAPRLERRIRRTENDPEVTAAYCLHPLARRFLVLGRPTALRLILDLTWQEDRLVRASLNVGYRGRALPLVWTLWPANQPLEGDGFWERIAGLLAQAAPLLPKGVPVTRLADRTFGTPVFTDLVAAHGWHWIVRVQDQTRYRDRLGRGRAGSGALSRRAQEVARAGLQKARLAGSQVVHRGERHAHPLCLASDLPPAWWPVAGYRQRFPVEAPFRDLQRYGGCWEQGQVRQLAHVERLWVGMALGMWVALMSGTWRAGQYLAQPPTGKRRTRPGEAKHSLFQLGLEALGGGLHADSPPPHLWRLTDWEAPNGSAHISAHHAQACLRMP